MFLPRQVIVGCSSVYFNLEILLVERGVQNMCYFLDTFVKLNFGNPMHC